jgi:hypothetical protein
MQQALKQSSKQQATSFNAEATRDEEERVTFRLVEDLQGVGVNVTDIKKLQEAGYMTIGNERIYYLSTTYKFETDDHDCPIRVGASSMHPRPPQHQGLIRR